MYPTLPITPSPQSSSLPSLPATPSPHSSSPIAKRSGAALADDPPRVSLIIPCHNEAQTLGRILEVMTKQDYPNFEILIIDDGSIDETPKIASAYPDFRLIQHQENRGLSAAYNTGIEHASGEILGTLHADCIPLSHEWISCCVTHFRDPTVGIVSSPFVIADQAEAGLINTIFMCVLRGDVDAATLRGKEAREIGFISGKCDFYRGSLLREIGGFRPLSSVAGEDKDLSLRVRGRGYRILLEPQAPVVHLYGSHQQGLLANWSKAIQYGEVVPLLYRIHGRIHSKDVAVNAILFLTAVGCLLLSLLTRSWFPITAALVLLLAKNVYKALPLLLARRFSLFLSALPIGMVDNLLMGFGVVKGPPRTTKKQQDATPR